VPRRELGARPGDRLGVCTASGCTTGLATKRSSPRAAACSFVANAVFSQRCCSSPLQQSASAPVKQESTSTDAGRVARLPGGAGARAGRQPLSQLVLCSAAGILDRDGRRTLRPGGDRSVRTRQHGDPRSCRRDRRGCEGRTARARRRRRRRPQRAAAARRLPRRRRDPRRTVWASPGLDVDTATDLLLLYGSSATYLTLRRYDWSDEHFATWSTDTLAKQLLARPGKA
jgi:hypothetical protein